MSLASIVERWATAVARHPRRTLVLAAALSALASIAVARLPILTSREALLPRDTPVGQRFERFLHDFGAASDLIVVVEGAPRAELARFSAELAERLGRTPRVRQASSRLDVRFFLEHAYLLLPAARLGELDAMLAGIASQRGAAIGDPQGLARAVEGATRSPGALAEVDLETAKLVLDLGTFFLGEWQRWLLSEQPPTDLAWGDLFARLGAGALAQGDGSFTSRDGRMLFVFVSPQSTSQEFAHLGPFVESVRQEAEALRAEWTRAGRVAPSIALTGLPATVYEEYTTVSRDVTFTVVTAALFILALVALWLRSLRWALALFVPMGLGVLWSTGLTLFTVGHMTILTSSFTAVLFGMGVDYGIFTSTRVREELAAGQPLVAAIGRGTGAAARGVLTAAGATLLIFAALTSVSFSGFVELGYVAASGVALVITSTFMVQPALFALWPPKPRAARAEAIPAMPRPLLPTRRAWAASALALAVALGLAAAGGAAGLRIPFDYDVLSLLPRDSEAARYQRRMVAESDFQGEVVILKARSLEEARRMTDEAKKLPSLARVESLTDLFPPDAEARAGVARRIAARVEAARDVALTRTASLHVDAGALAFAGTRLAGLDSALEDAEELAFSAGRGELVGRIEELRKRGATIRAELASHPEHAQVATAALAQATRAAAQTGLDLLASWRNARPLTPADLPAMLRGRFFGADGSVAMYGFPARSVYDPAELDRMLAEVYRVSPEATGFPATHQVFSKMVVDSFERGTLLAFALTILWLFAATRGWRSFFVALMPLVVGGGWMLGLLALTGVKLSYANIIALPLVMGLGVDYGVWLAHRRGELASLSAWEVMRKAASAIALAAGTTLAGLGAITLANHRGVSSLGIAITVGLCCCLAAALGVAPALAQLLSERKS